jgi:Ca2+-binding RTX toxin-like protein
MSFLRRGERRRGKVAAALTTVGALAAFQALAIVGASTAGATGTCNYNPANDTVSITIDAGTNVQVAVEGDADLDPAAAPGSILTNVTGAFLACGSAANSNTTNIVVLGQPSSDEGFAINNFIGDATGDAGGAEFSTTIAWNIDLGTGSADLFAIHLANGDDTVTATNTSFDLNGGTGELLGEETILVAGEDGDDTIDLSATSVTNISGAGPGDDFIAPGTGGVLPAGPDSVAGQAGVDTLSYATRTTSVTVINGNVAGNESGDGDFADPGDEVDLIDCFEVVETGSGNDTLNDNGCGGSNIYAPGDGDDVVNGNNPDWIDWSGSSAGMTIDIPNASATGQGTDTWTGIVRFIGSTFDDTMLVTNGAPGPGVSEFFGGTGVDTVDGSAGTVAQFINLDILDPSGADDLENATGGSGSDSVHGNDNRNTLMGNDGDDFLDGQPGNDTLFGGLGNDTFFGDTGADTVSFAQAPGPNGENVDLSLGFATGSEGDDGFNDGVEIIVGSPFNDHITGGPFGGGGTVNFLFKGGAGKDTLTGFNGNDTLQGGGGKDTLRGVGGDDTLNGKGGNDLLSGGGGFDIGNGGNGKDVCKGVEQRHSCGTQGNPARPQTAVGKRD